MRDNERTLKGGERSELLWDPRNGGTTQQGVLNLTYTTEGALTLNLAIEGSPGKPILLLDPKVVLPNTR